MEDLDNDAPAPDPEASVSPEPEDDGATSGGEADPEGTPEADETTDDEDSDAPAKGGSPAYDKLLAKYGGDKEKMAEGIWEQMNSTARTHQELAEMKAILAELKDSKQSEAKIEEAVSEDPSVKEIITELASISEEAKQSIDQQKQLSINFNKAEQKLARLEGALSKADESEQYQIREEIREVKTEMNDIRSEYKTLQRDYKTLQRQNQDNIRGLKKAQAEAKARVEKEREDSFRLQQDAVLAKREFDGALREETKIFGIDPNSKSYQYISNTIRTQIRDHMQALRSKGVTEGIDIPEAVKVLMKEYAEVAQMKPKFARVSKAKAEVTEKLPEAKPATESRRSGSKQGVQDAKFWKDRARTLMP